MTDLIERAKAALEIVGDDTWSLTPQETYDGRSTTQYYRVMDQNLNAICCEEYGAHCDGGVKKIRLIALTPADALAAREARDKKVREEALREAAATVGQLDDHMTEKQMDVAELAILALVRQDDSMIEGKTDE